MSTSFTAKALYLLFLYIQFYYVLSQNHTIFYASMDDASKFNYSPDTQFVMDSSCPYNSICAKMHVTNPASYLETKIYGINTIGYTDIILQIHFLFQGFGTGIFAIYEKLDASTNGAALIHMYDQDDIQHNTVHRKSFNLTQSAENNDKFGVQFITMADFTATAYVYIDNMYIFGTKQSSSAPTNHPSLHPVTSPTSGPTEIPSIQPTSSPLPALPRIIDTPPIWYDDYDDDNPLPGWSYIDNNAGYTNDRITNGVNGTIYHGPYEAISGVPLEDFYSISQQFYCGHKSSVDVYYNLYSCGTEGGDWIKLILNEQQYKIPLASNNKTYIDSALNASLTQKACDRDWETFGLLGPYIITEVDVNTLFTVNFTVRLTNPAEAVAINNVNIACNPITNTTTTPVVTVSPTLTPIPSVDVTNGPITSYTTKPTPKPLLNVIIKPTPSPTPKPTLKPTRIYSIQSTFNTTSNTTFKPILNEDHRSGSELWLTSAEIYIYIIALILLCVIGIYCVWVKSNNKAKEKHIEKLNEHQVATNIMSTNDSDEEMEDMYINIATPTTDAGVSSKGNHNALDSNEESIEEMYDNVNTPNIEFYVLFDYFFIVYARTERL